MFQKLVVTFATRFRLAAGLPSVQVSFSELSVAVSAGHSGQAFVTTNLAARAWPKLHADNHRKQQTSAESRIAPLERALRNEPGKHDNGQATACTMLNRRKELCDMKYKLLRSILAHACVWTLLIGCSEDAVRPLDQGPDFLFGSGECLLGEPYCQYLKGKIDYMMRNHPDAVCRAHAQSAMNRFNAPSGSGFEWGNRDGLSGACADTILSYVTYYGIHKDTFGVALWAESKNEYTRMCMRYFDFLADPSRYGAIAHEEGGHQAGLTGTYISDDPDSLAYRLTRRCGISF